MKYVSGRILRGKYIWLGLERGSGRANIIIIIIIIINETVQCNNVYYYYYYYYYYTIWMSLVTGPFFLVLLLNQR